MNVVVVGGKGKLGSLICKQLKINEINTIIVDLNAEITSINEIKDKITAIIDVSSPQNSIKTTLFASKNKIPLIIGCTGHDKQELKIIENCSLKSPIFLSYNFSLALQYFYEAIRSLSHLDSNVYITEKHHKQKKDKPSGTAKEIEKNIPQSNLKKINSIREGNIIGYHEVEFYCKNEKISITHEVFDRKTFAEGCVFALNFILSKKTGIYHMSNLIKTQNKNKKA